MTLRLRRSHPGAASKLWSLACLGLCASFARPAFCAEPVEHWTASSTTATAVTGDVAFTGTAITFHNGASLHLAPAGQVDAFKDAGEVVHAAMYRVVEPADPLLLNGNRLCGGGRPVTYLAVSQPAPLPGDKSPRSMSAFSGAQRPSSTDTKGFCGTYNYDLR